MRLAQSIGGAAFDPGSGDCSAGAGMREGGEGGMGDPPVANCMRAAKQNAIRAVMPREPCVKARGAFGFQQLHSGTARLKCMQPMVRLHRYRGNA